MPGYMFLFGPCIACGNLFTYNADAVPSIDLGDGRGRQPVCADCVARANPERAKKGLPPIVPLPDAYEPQEGP